MTDTQELIEALEKVMPIRVNDGPDYAEAYFADGQKHSTQAMTMNPQDWRDLQAAWEAFRARSADEQPTPPDDLVEVQKIETVTGTFLTTPGKPFWRIEIGGYCADFDHEQAARNFAGAINARLQALSPHLSEREKIVAWLREESRCWRAMIPPRNREASALTAAADDIRRGDHISGEGR